MTESEAPPRPSLPDDLEDLSHSCTLVYWILEWYGPLTSAEIAEDLPLNVRTVRHTLHTLRKEGLVERRTDSRDARRKLYLVVGEEGE